MRWLGAAILVLVLVAAATWVVDREGVPWVRVANPGRAWFQRLRAEPRVELVRQGVAQAAIARPRDGMEARAAADRAFRAKYGAVDWWYGLLVRTDAIPVRLEPAP
jgi:hypothetical protein